MQRSLLQSVGSTSSMCRYDEIRELLDALGYDLAKPPSPNVVELDRRVTGNPKAKSRLEGVRQLPGAKLHAGEGDASELFARFDFEVVRAPGHFPLTPPAP
jgi:hypothetical protein